MGNSCGVLQYTCSSKRVPGSQAFASKSRGNCLETWGSFHDHKATGKMYPDTSPKFVSRKVILGRRCTPPNVLPPTPVDPPSVHIDSGEVEQLPGAEFALGASSVKAPCIAEHDEEVAGSQLLSTLNHALVDNQNAGDLNGTSVVEDIVKGECSQSRYCAPPVSTILLSVLLSCFVSYCARQQEHSCPKHLVGELTRFEYAMGMRAWYKRVWKMSLHGSHLPG